MTIFATVSSTKGYKDIVTSFKTDSTDKKTWQRLALFNIVKRTYWDEKDFIRYGYTKISYKRKRIDTEQ